MPKAWGKLPPPQLSRILWQWNPVLDLQPSVHLTDNREGDGLQHWLDVTVLAVTGMCP